MRHQRAVGVDGHNRGVANPRRRRTLSKYYPDVAAVGFLAEALTYAFSKMGSSLRAYSPVPLDEPLNPSPLSGYLINHPEDPRETEPDWARVRVGDRACQVIAAYYTVPLGSFELGFHSEDESDDAQLRRTISRIIPIPDHMKGLPSGPLGMIVTEDLATTAHIIRRFFEDRAELGDLAQEYGVPFQPYVRMRINPDTVNNWVRNMLEKIEKTDKQTARDLRLQWEEKRRRREE